MGERSFSSIHSPTMISCCKPGAVLGKRYIKREQTGRVQLKLLRRIESKYISSGKYDNGCQLNNISK